MCCPCKCSESCSFLLAMNRSVKGCCLINERFPPWLCHEIRLLSSTSIFICLFCKNCLMETPKTNWLFPTGTAVFTETVLLEQLSVCPR